MKELQKEKVDDENKIKQFKAQIEEYNSQLAKSQINQNTQKQEYDLKLKEFQSTLEKKYKELYQNEINRNLNTKSAIIDESTMINKKQLIQNKYKEALETYKAIISQINLKLQSENKEQKYLIINAYKEYSSNIIKQLNELNKYNKFTK